MCADTNWKEELKEWEEAIAEKNKDRAIIEDLVKTPRAKMSNLIKCYRSARVNSELWNIFIALDDKIKNGSLTVEEYEEGDFEENVEASNLMHAYARWFRLKNDIKEVSVPYIYCFHAMKHAANRGGEVDDEDIKNIFRVLSSLVDEDI